MSKSSKCNDSDFNLSFKKTEVKEGRTFGSTLASSKCHANRTIYWKYSGEGITEDDFVDEALQGSFKLNDKGTYKYTYTIKRDGKLEGNETLKVEFFTDSKQTNKIAEESIILLDKSISPDDMDQGDPNEPYKLTESRPHIKENVVIRTTISNGVPGTTVYFSVDGKGIDKDDLDLNYGRLKGEAVIQDKGEAVIPFLFRADHKTEGEEKATVTIYEDKQRKKVLNKVSFPVIDTSIQTPDQSPTKSVEPGKPQQTWGPYTKQGTWFTLSPSRPDIKENNSTRTRIDSNAKENRRLYFNITGKGINKDDLDLSYGRMEGEAITNSNGVALIPHLLRNDNNTEGTEEMTLTLYSDKKRRQYITSTTIPILDTSIESPGHPPTKSVTPSKKQTLWGGGEVGGTWFTLSPNRPDYKDNELIKTRIDSDSLPGAVVYYELSGRGISAKSLDTSNGLGGMTGKASIEVNGLANIEHLIKEDETSYEDRELTISLYKDKKLTRQLASTTVPIDNITVKPGLSIEATSNTVNEGQGVKLKTFVQGYDLNKIFYWDIQGVNITSGDFSASNSLSGTAKRSAGNKKFTLDFKTSKDKLTEGQESFKLFLYSDSGKTDLIGTSEEVMLNDTSTTPLQAYNVFAKPTAVNEGKGFTVKVNTKNVDSGTNFYWRSAGSATSSDVVISNGSPATSGITTIDNSGKASIEYETIKDQLTEGDETFTVSLFSDPNFVRPIADPVSVVVRDTSKTRLKTYDVFAKPPAVNEGKGFKVRVKTKNVEADTILYWQSSGPAMFDDVVMSNGNPATSGLTTIDNSGKASIEYETIKDKLTEGEEAFTVSLFSDPNFVSPIADPVSVIIRDTSKGV